LIHPPRTRRIALALYWSGLSARAVSQRLHDEFGFEVTPQTVSKWARETRINRPPGGQRIALPEERLRALYEDGGTVPQLSQRYHVSRALVWERLHEAGTNMRPGGTIYGMLNSELLRDLYWGQDLSSRNIAARVGCSEAAVFWRLRAYGIPRKRNWKKR